MQDKLRVVHLEPKAITIDALSDEAIVITEKSQSDDGWYAYLDLHGIPCKDFTQYHTRREASVQYCAKNIRSNAAGYGRNGEIHASLQADSLSKVMEYWAEKDKKISANQIALPVDAKHERKVTAAKTKCPETPVYGIPVKIDIDSRSIIAQQYLKAVDHLYAVSKEAVEKDKALHQELHTGDEAVIKANVIASIKALAKTHVTMPVHPTLKIGVMISRLADKIIGEVKDSMLRDNHERLSA